MRTAKGLDKLIQFALAAALLAPLLAAFSGSGGLEDAFATSQSAEAAAARRWVLLCAAGQSLLIGSLSAAIAALVGIPAAWALSGRRVSAAKIALVVLPLALPAPVAVSGWIQLIAPGATSSFALQTPGAPLPLHWPTRSCSVRSARRLFSA